MGAFSPSVTKIRMRGLECRKLGVEEKAGSDSSLAARYY